MSYKLPSRIEVRLIDPKKNVDLSTHYAFLKKRHHVVDEDLSFNKLTLSQKKNIIRTSKEAFIQKEPTKWWDIFNCMKKPKTITHKKINSCIFDIINFLSLYIHEVVYAFRLENKDSDLQFYVDKLARNEQIDYTTLDPSKLCTILKKYILNHLNGVFPEEISSYLLNTARVKNRLQYKALLSYLPFALSSDEAKLLQMLFDLFRIIDKHKETTLMSMDSLIKLFSLVLFPASSFKSLDVLQLVESTLKDTLNLDFDTIPFTMIPRIVHYV